MARLDALVRKAVKIADKQTLSLQEDELVLRRWTSQTGMGDTTYTNLTFRGVVNTKMTSRRLQDGRIVNISATVTVLQQLPDLVNAPQFPRINPIDPRDEVILSDGTSGPIVDTEGPHDPSRDRPFMYELFLGTQQQGNL